MLLARKGYTSNRFGELVPIVDEEPEGGAYDSTDKGHAEAHAAELAEQGDKFSREDEITYRPGTTLDTIGRERPVYDGNSDGVSRADNVYVDGVLAAVELLKPFFNLSDKGPNTPQDNGTEGGWGDVYFTGGLWHDKVRNKLATGSVRFTTGPDGNVAFYCVVKGCGCQHTWSGFAGSARDFIWLAFVHGLNHAAKWNRPYGEKVTSDPYLPEQIAAVMLTDEPVWI